MILTLLSNPVFQVAVFVIGSIVLYRILKRNRKEREAKETAAARGGRRARPAFRDFRWGERPRAEMVLYHDGADERLFTRPGESLKVGESPLTSIFYSYYLDRLQAVMIEMPHRSTKEVLRTMADKWGQPVRADAEVPKYSWPEIPGEAEWTQAVLDDSPLKHYASLVISSRKLMDERKARGRRAPLGSLSGRKAEEERASAAATAARRVSLSREAEQARGGDGATVPARRAPLGSLSGAKARSEGER
ncbi:MAG TPA: hypothetical protein VGR00_07475, partial [Thermoanaerobaculia bacterium]|nr:hypothetical protein [Thermoanaerobaculia bacterium]